MLYRLVSIYSMTYTLITFIIGFPLAFLLWLVTVLFDKKLRLLHLYTSYWGVSFLAINPFLKVKMEGREKINKKETYVMISNHQSLLDIVVLYGIMAHFKWVAKRELYMVPVIGWVMRLNRYVAVDRANKTSHLRMFSECEAHLANGSSIMIFPEGTRSENAEVQFFKEGAFKMALASGKAILPIVLDGTAAAIPKKGLFFKEMSTIYLRVMDPFPYESFKGMTPKELAAQCQKLVAQELGKLRAANK